MTTEELKEWMNERFDTQNNFLLGIASQLQKMNDKVTSHDRWLWLIKGVGVTIMAILGVFGIKTKFF